MTSPLRKREQCSTAFRNAVQTFIHPNTSLNTITNTLTLTKQILGKAAVRSWGKGIVGKGICPAAVASCLGWRQQFLSSLTFCFLFLSSTHPQKGHTISPPLTSTLSLSSGPSHLDHFQQNTTKIIENIISTTHNICACLVVIFTDHTVFLLYQWRMSV